jgi:hypothetical protein
VLFGDEQDTSRLATLPNLNEVLTEETQEEVQITENAPYIVSKTGAICFTKLILNFVTFASFSSFVNLEKLVISCVEQIILSM